MAEVTATPNHVCLDLVPLHSPDHPQHRNSALSRHTLSLWTAFGFTCTKWLGPQESLPVQASQRR